VSWASTIMSFVPGGILYIGCSFTALIDAVPY
jgi:hypothetical protein